jgi:hypothetical protein
LRIDQETGPAFVLFRWDSARFDGAADDPNIRPIENYRLDLKRKITTEEMRFDDP